MTKYTYQNQNARSEHTNDNPNDKNTSAQSRERYALDGYTPPAGIVGVEAVKEMQRWLGGLTVDGMWGPKTQKQFDKAMAAVLGTTLMPSLPADRERLGYVEEIYKLSLGVAKAIGAIIWRGVMIRPQTLKARRMCARFRRNTGWM